MNAPLALYAAFDVVPSAKGAALHIAHVAQALERAAGSVRVVALGAGELPARESDGRTEIVRVPGSAVDFVERVRRFQAAVAVEIAAARGTLAVLQFRDPWAGIPMLDARGSMPAVYEINGFPSIELPYRYPALRARTLARIRAMEDRCLEESDFILAPAASIAANLTRRGVARSRITVIPNGADIVASQARPAGAPARYVLYFGALQAWQGVGVLLRAFALLADIEPLELVICASAPPRSGAALRALAARPELATRVRWIHQLSRDDLAPWLANAEFSVAPLAETARNLDQGCCPLKILESMAAGVPVIASDLAPVRELMTHGEHGLLVRPDRPGSLARAMRALLDDPAATARMGRSAQQRVREHYTWDSVEARLVQWLRGAVLQRGRDEQSASQVRSA